MTLTRWKVMAGALGLSLGGLAALADPPPEAPPALPPVPVAFPGPAAPALDPILLPPAEDKVPQVPAPPATPTVSAKPAREVAPPPRLAGEQVLEMTVPALAVAPAGSAPAVQPVGATQPESAPAIPTMPPAPAPVSVPVAAAAPAVLNPVPPAPVPAPAAAPPALVAAAPAPAPVAPAVADKKLRVLLNMGEDRPRFEVKDGEETLLKLVSEKVDVKSPADRGETLPTMRAVGAVSFFTPGGEGVCDELTLTPGTGQVVVTGKVKFRYHWGKVETEVSGDRMTFRLGAAPGVVPASSAPAGGTTAIPASYQSPR